MDQAVIPMGECVAGFNFWMWTILIVAAVFWLLRLVFVIYNTSLNWEIRAFYRTALGIADVRLHAGLIKIRKLCKYAYVHICRSILIT